MTALIRRAAAADAEAVAEMYVRARHHAVPAVPPLMAPDDRVRAWLGGVVRSGAEVWVGEAEEGGIVGMMLLEGDWVMQLYVDPAWLGKGLGSALIEVAQRHRPDGLQLWTFQTNPGAHRFYERHGFVAVERTDGRGNREQTPDVRYVWRPSPSGPAG